MVFLTVHSEQNGAKCRIAVICLTVVFAVFFNRTLGTLGGWEGGGDCRTRNLLKSPGLSLHKYRNPANKVIFAHVH